MQSRPPEDSPDGDDLIDDGEGEPVSCVCYVYDAGNRVIQMTDLICPWEGSVREEQDDGADWDG